MARHICLDPQTVDKNTWYYEYPTHILIVREARTKSGEFIQSEQFKLPWRLLEQSRKRWAAGKQKTKSVR